MSNYQKGKIILWTVGVVLVHILISELSIPVVVEIAITLFIAGLILLGLLLITAEKEEAK